MHPTLELKPESQLQEGWVSAPVVMGGTDTGKDLSSWQFRTLKCFCFPAAWRNSIAHGSTCRAGGSGSLPPEERGPGRCPSQGRCSADNVFFLLKPWWKDSLTTFLSSITPSFLLSLPMTLRDKHIGRSVGRTPCSGWFRSTNDPLDLSCRKNRPHCTSPLAWARQRLCSCCCSTWPTLTPPPPTATPRCTSLPARGSSTSPPCSSRPAPLTPCPPR